jgi:sec-independent protein translocase protein TatC
LYQHEKRLARPLLVASTLLFYAGCAFTYFLMLPIMFAYLDRERAAGRGDDDRHRPLPRVRAGDVPVRRHQLSRCRWRCWIAVILGWVTPQQLSAWRGYVVVAIFIIAAILTRPTACRRS